VGRYGDVGYGGLQFGTDLASLSSLFVAPGAFFLCRVAYTSVSDNLRGWVWKLSPVTRILLLLLRPGEFVPTSDSLRFCL